MSPRVTSEHKERRRQQILDAAARSFLKRGFAETTMQDILAESGLSAGAVYNYFTGKADLYAALLDQSVQQLVDSYRREITRHEQIWDRLRALIHLHFGSFHTDRQQEITRLYLLDFLPASAHDAVLRERLSRRNRIIQGLFRDLLRIGIERREFHPVDTDATAALILAAGDGVRLHALTTGTLADADAMFEAFVANLQAVLTPRH